MRRAENVKDKRINLLGIRGYQNCQIVMSSVEKFFEIQTAADVIFMIQPCVSFTQSETYRKHENNVTTAVRWHQNEKKEILGQCQGC